MRSRWRQFRGWVCRQFHHNLKWGRSWYGYHPALTPGDPEALVKLRGCWCRRVLHMEEIQWGDGEVT